MNGLDYAILAVIGLGAIFGSGRGMLRIASSLIALVAAVYLAALYSQAAGAYLSRAFSVRPGTGAVLGYVVIFLTVMVIVAWGGTKLAQLVRAVHMSWADRLGGAAVGAALGALLAGLIVVVATVTLPADTPVIRQSQLAPRVLDFTHDLAGFVPAQVRDEYYYREAQLITYWNQHRTAPSEPASGPAAAP
ncbi:MAG TPA: CvpA family protein [Candidatus Binataceae bacterium]|nr:CvpA family protein [Candidatus Binataceae bacterium]